MRFESPMASLRESVPFLSFLPTSRYALREPSPRDNDFMFGNPHEMSIPGYVASLARNAVPQDKDWFAYKMNERVPTETVARALSSHTGLAWSPDDVFLTTGGFAAISASLRAIAGPGDEVVFLSPPWFFYELLIRATGATPVRVPLQAPAFDLPHDAIARALTPRTCAVLINSPHNPTGRVYDGRALQELARLLDERSRREDRPIFLLSDEAYRKIVFDGRRAPSPAEHYARTIVLYSYGKQLLAPGQRIGYAAVPPAMPEREALREAMMLATCASGYTFPNALLQHALPEIESQCIDVSAIARRRDRVVSGLEAMGLQVVRPEGTFYVLVGSPDGDEPRFVDRLADRDTYVLPGSIVELPGWVRISLTANDAMVERGLAAFASVVG